MSEPLKIQIVLYNKQSIELTLYSRKECFKYLKCLEFVEDAYFHGESPHQILEGCRYEYKLSDNKFQIEASTIIIPTLLEGSSSGSIVPNIYVGTLELAIIEIETKTVVGKTNLEVRSKKMDYRTDYRSMLNDITQYCTDLLLQQGALTTQGLELDHTATSASNYQRFAFIKSIIESESFDNSIAKILQSPNKKWSEYNTIRSICNTKRLKHSTLKQIASSRNRYPLSHTHPLYSKIPSVPTTVQVTEKRESLDTAENRFVKYVLEHFSWFCSSLKNHKNASSRLKNEAKLIINILENKLSNPLFKKISKLNILPLNSPVLQRKEGYREVLQTWLMFDLAAKLSWEGGNDIYSAGKRNVATLYEYWLFFKLLETFGSIFSIKPQEFNNLIDNDSLNIRLKQGRTIAISGVYEHPTRYLNVEFSYNRTFSANQDTNAAGSWTRIMRPDYTLSIWPYNITQEEAEAEELIVHLHFDAKYRIQDVSSLFCNNTSQEQLDNQKSEEEKGEYKRADLLKMHAYKDSIRRTSGAYIIYPGSKSEDVRGFHEIIPGLGAFAISPQNFNSSLIEFNKFITSVVDHLLNRVSQREQLAYQKYKINQTKPRTLKEELPETYGENRDLLPSSTNILIGYYKNPEHLEWINKNNLYNTRTGSGNGSLYLESAAVSARYLLLHTKGESKTSRLYKLEPLGPRIFSKENLEKRGYNDPSQPYYLVYKISQCRIEKELENLTWDIRKLTKYESRHASAKPFTATLEDLMRAREE